MKSPSIELKDQQEEWGADMLQVLQVTLIYLHASPSQLAADYQ